jgi:hypothetical protein
MKDSRVDLMVSNVLTVPDLAAMDAPMDVSKTGIWAARCVLVAHESQFQVRTNTSHLRFYTDPFRKSRNLQDFKVQNAKDSWRQKWTA